MKEGSGKKMLIVKVSQNDPLYSSNSKIKYMRQSIMIKEKVINNPNLLGMGVSQYLMVPRRCPTFGTKK